MEMLKKVSKISFVIGVVLAVASASYTFYLQYNAPEGFCPLNPTRPYMKVALVLLIASMIIDFGIGYHNKKLEKNQGENRE